MSIRALRRPCVFALLVTAALLSRATPALAQTMNVVGYYDLWSSSDGSTIYGYSALTDNSSGCNHYNYASTTYLYSPSRNVAGSDPTQGLALGGETGDWTVDGVLTFDCSCAGTTIGAGGGITIPIQSESYTHHYYLTTMSMPRSTYTREADSDGLTCSSPTKDFDGNQFYMTDNGLFYHWSDGTPIVCASICVNGRSGTVHGPAGGGNGTNVCL
jgi:hypothetical protein